MKIKDYAAEKGITRDAIYKAVSRAGRSTRDLTDKRGNITTKGRAILDELFPDEQEPISEPLSEPPKEAKAEDSTLDELRDRLREAQERAEKWERLYLELQDRAAQEREAHREELRAAHVLAAQAQETISALSAKKNPILRLFSGRKKEQRHTAADGEVK